MAKQIGTPDNYRQIWLQQLGIFTDYNVRRLQKKVATKMFTNVKLIVGSTQEGYIIGIETNLKEPDETIINYFLKVALLSI